MNIKTLIGMSSYFLSTLPKWNYYCMPYKPPTLGCLAREEKEKAALS